MPDLTFELAIQAEKSHTLIAGIDEAGRGALAGPVVAAAVILPLETPERLSQLAEVNDSKQLSAAQREHLYALITANALTFGVGSASAARIDEIGIMGATKEAMLAAVAQLQPAPRYLLIDGPVRLSATPLPQRAIVRGDSRSLSIAAASIIAKVVRDRHMVALAADHPQYGLAQHKGYGTQLHTAAIAQHGPCAIHRQSFAPIRQTLFKV